MSTQCPPRPAPRAARERGQAMLLTVLLLGVGVTAVIYNFVAPARQSIERDRITAAALAQARNALIGRAAADPDRPGALPCPDTNNDGDADSPCGATGVTAIGRLPWKTLGLPDLRDGWGECLWYAVSANFKKSGASSPDVVNSDSVGTLVVNDSAGAPVFFAPNAALAIVFSPGPALPSQDRSPSGTTVCGGNTTAANYLDTRTIGAANYNNATGGGTNTFIAASQSPGTTDLNDKLLPITHQALFSVVEQRVAGEVAKAVRNFRSNYGTYPWLAAFDPTAAEYTATVNTAFGALPFHVTGQTFSTSFSWSIPGLCAGCFNLSGSITDADMLNSANAVATGTCKWKHDSGGTDPMSQVDCTGTTPAPAPGTVRTVSIRFVAPASSWTIAQATAGSRTLRTANNSALVGVMLNLTDTGDSIGTGNILSTPPAGTIAASGIRVYPMLPDWYGPQSMQGNNWHQLVYVAIAPGFVPGAVQDCSGNCFAVQLNGAAGVTNVQAIALIAGRTLASTEYLEIAGPPDPPQTRTPHNPNLYSYFDSANNVTAGTLLFDRKTLPATAFNDQLRIIAP